MHRARSLPVNSVWIYVQAAAVGLLGGALGVPFRLGVDALWELMMGEGAPVTNRLTPFWSVVIPAFGGLGAGLLLLAIKNRRGPFGIADTMELVQTRRGRIQPLRSLVQVLSSGITLSTGGSIGREAANSQFGATIASVLGHVFPNSPRSRTVLLGCGIAAGMSSAYKAPIAGAIFVMEVVLGNFAMDVLAPIVVASVVSTLVTAAAFDKDPLYQIGGAGLSLEDPQLVLSAALLGALCGCGGPAFRWALGLGKRAFERVPAPLALKMMIGGAIVGVIGIWYPEVWGNGQTTIHVIADEEIRLTFTLFSALLLSKVVATAATTGSGALGGVFTPTLVVGAAFGAAFAFVVAVFTGVVHRTEFALVGMAGLCAASTHAPITAMVLVFEMTQDYGLILPLMLCSIVASIVARLIDQDSIYTARLRARGHEIFEGIEELAVHRNYVRDVMRRDQPQVVDTAPFDDVLALFNARRTATIYVTDRKGVLLGHIQLHDVKQFINDPTLKHVVIAADLTRTSPFVHADESLGAIMPRFADPDLDELPVVHSATEPRLEGRVTRHDVVACLSDEVLGQRSLRAKLKAPEDKEATYVELPRDVSLARVRVPPPLVDRSLQSLDLTTEHRVTPLLVVRTDPLGREERLVADGTLVLEERDELILIGGDTALETFRAQFGQNSPGRTNEAS